MRVLLLILFISSVKAATEQTYSRFASWGIDPEKGLASINLRADKLKSKKNVIVAVIDTGIDQKNPFISENMLTAVDFTGTGTNDQHGHGTHIASIIKSVAPEARILSLKYYHPDQTTDESIAATVRAIRYSISIKVDFINYSSAGTGQSPAEMQVLKEAAKAGILVIAAAGNRGEDIDKGHHTYPASYGLSNLLIVAGHDDQMKLVPSSNYGFRTVDLVAPGHRIRGAIPGNKTAYMTGTSQATAFVTGVAALIKARHPHITGSEIKEIILSSSLQVKGFEKKVAGGKKLDAARALEFAGNRLPANLEK